MRTALPGVNFGSANLRQLPVLEYTKLVLHPSLAVQNSRGGSGGTISAMHIDPATGDLFIDHGDWNANTGPVDVVAYRNDQPYTPFTNCPTEALRWKFFDGNAYGLWVDPRGSWNSPQFATVRRNGVWSHEFGTVPFVHVLDMVKFGNDYFIGGSAPSVSNPAWGMSAIARSTDMGLTWTQVYAQGSSSNETDRVEQFYIVNGVLLARRKPASGSSNIIVKWTGIDWVDVTSSYSNWYFQGDTLDYVSGSRITSGKIIYDIDTNKKWSQPPDPQRVGGGGTAWVTAVWLDGNYVYGQSSYASSPYTLWRTNLADTTPVWKPVINQAPADVKGFQLELTPDKQTLYMGGFQGALYKIPVYGQMNNW